MAQGEHMDNVKGSMLRRTWLQTIYAVLVGMLMCSCGSGDSCTIEGTLSDNANTNLYIKYYSGEQVLTGVTAAREGKFDVRLHLWQPSIIEIYDKENRMLGRLYAVPGDKLKIDIDMNDPLLNKITGNEVDERWTSMISDNAQVLKGRARDINDFVADYVESNPADMVSALMFLCFYDASIDPQRANEVFDKLSPDVRPASIVGPYVLIGARYVDPSAKGKLQPFKYREASRDSAVTLDLSRKPLTMIVVSDEYSQRSDSVVPAMRRMVNDYGPARLQVMDIGLYSDTAMWKRAIANDSAKWIQAWVPGGILSPALDVLAIPAVPYYILVDSTGTQLYRGRTAPPPQFHAN